MENVQERARKANSGLARWMDEVLKQADVAADGFEADPVHDLRVAIRRCRSMAEGLRAIDPDAQWKKMRRSARDLFSSLGRLRDTQVLTEWLGKLTSPDDPVAQQLFVYCQSQEQSLKPEAERQLDAFDRKRWRSWSVSLPGRALRLQIHKEAFEALALERWMQARRLHHHALRTGRPAAWHRLRIGIKKFRYVVENFLPELHEQWCEGLKHWQDLLGEVQDLNVLWETALRIGALVDLRVRESWALTVLGERDARLQRYREESAGDESFWKVWRDGLPRGQHAKAASLKKLQTWASLLDPDVRHSRRVARLALQVHRGLSRLGLVGDESAHSEEILLATTSMLGAGRSTGGKYRPRFGERMLERVERPVSWGRQDQQMMGAIMRLSRGSLEGEHLAALRTLPVPLQRTTRKLAGIVRLADALAGARDGAIGRLVVSSAGNSLIMAAEGFNPQSTTAEKIAAARYLLELSLGIPILIRPRNMSKALKTKSLRRL